MSRESNSTNSSPHGIDTLIGAGMHITGEVSCNGVLRVQGDISGVVSCDGNSGATLVVDSTGSVTGPVSAAHVIVRGRVTGPVQSSQSIEIHQGAIVAGDVAFKEIAVHAGGVLEGLLSPLVAIDAAPGGAENKAPLVTRSADKKLPAPFTGGGGFLERLGGVRGASIVAALSIIAITIAWMGRDQTVMPRHDDTVAFRADVSVKGTADQNPATAGGAQTQSVSSAPAGDGGAASPVPAASVDTKSDSPTDSSVRSRKDSGKVVTVRGANPNRPAGVFLLISNEASVLYRKKRDDPGEGTRVPVAQGEKVSVTFAQDELIRITNGRDVVIFYQGQKVASNTIESGAWISFVPRTSGSGNGTGVRTDN